MKRDRESIEYCEGISYIPIPFVCSTAHPEYLNLKVSLSKYDKGDCVNMYAPTDTLHTTRSRHYTLCTQSTPSGTISPVVMCVYINYELIMWDIK